MGAVRDQVNQTYYSSMDWYIAYMRILDLNKSSNDEHILNLRTKLFREAENFTLNSVQHLIGQTCVGHSPDQISMVELVE